MNRYCTSSAHYEIHEKYSSGKAERKSCLILPCEALLLTLLYKFNIHMRIRENSFA